MSACLALSQCHTVPRALCLWKGWLKVICIRVVIARGRGQGAYSGLLPPYRGSSLAEAECTNQEAEGVRQADRGRRGRKRGESEHMADCL